MGEVVKNIISLLMSRERERKRKVRFTFDSELLVLVECG